MCDFGGAVDFLWDFTWAEFFGLVLKKTLFFIFSKKNSTTPNVYKGACRNKGHILGRYSILLV